MNKVAQENPMQLETDNDDIALMFLADNPQFAEKMKTQKFDVEKFFEEKKGITVDSARNCGAKYTAIDICRFAKEYASQFTKCYPNSDPIDRAFTSQVSDEEIETASLTYRDKSDDENTNEDTMQIEVHWYDKQEAFTAGAKWMRTRTEQPKQDEAKETEWLPCPNCGDTSRAYKFGDFCTSCNWHIIF
jgi:hypothetical protein